MCVCCCVCAHICTYRFAVHSWLFWSGLVGWSVVPVSDTPDPRPVPDTVDPTPDSRPFRRLMSAATMNSSAEVYVESIVLFLVEARTVLRVDDGMAWIRAAVVAAEAHAAQALRRDDVQAAAAVLLDAELLSLVSTVSLALALVSLFFALRVADPVRHPLDTQMQDAAAFEDRGGSGSGKRDVYASLKNYAAAKASHKSSTAVTGNGLGLGRAFVQLPQLNIQQQQQQQQQRFDLTSSAAVAAPSSSSSYSASSSRGAGTAAGNGAPYTPVSSSPAMSGYESDFTGRCVHFSALFLPIYVPFVHPFLFVGFPSSDYIASPSDDFFAYTGKKTMMVDALLKGGSRRRVRCVCVF